MAVLAFKRVILDCCEFVQRLGYALNTTQGYRVRPCLEKQNQKVLKVEVTSCFIYCDNQMRSLN